MPSFKTFCNQSSQRGISKRIDTMINGPIRLDIDLLVCAHGFSTNDVGTIGYIHVLKEEGSCTISRIVHKY